MADNASAADRKSDAELVERCLGGDGQAQRELFRLHGRGVHLALFRILGPSSDLEDLIQESFIQIFRSLPGFRGESALATWIGRITTRVAFAHIHKRKKRTERVAELARTTDHVDEQTPLDILASRRAVEALYGVLDRIDAKYRIAYALHVIDGRPLAEVAALTDSSVTAAKSRVWRARREVNQRAAKDPHLARYLAAQEDDA